MGSSDITSDSGAVELPKGLRQKIASAVADIEVIAQLTREASSINAATLTRLTKEAIRTIEDVNRQLAYASLTDGQKSLLRERLLEMLEYHEQLLAACQWQGLSRIEVAFLPSPSREWGTVDDFLDGLSLGGWNRFKDGEKEDGILSDFVGGLLLRPKRRK